MRKFILLVLLLNSSFLAVYSQFAIQYDFTRPLGEQGTHISQVHGLIVGYEHRLKNSPFYAGAEISFNVYGLKTLEQELPFHNGYITKTDVHYSTSYNTYAATLKLQPPAKGVHPFGTIRAGVLHYHSNMTIEDPDDPMGCKPLEKKVLLKDFTWLASAGAGADVDWTAFKPGSTSNVMLSFAVLYTVGGPADYMKMSNSADPIDPKGRIYYAKFEHVPSGEVHDHPVGKIYNSFASLLALRLGIKFKLD